ncbi:MAG: MFS transporter [Anaerolineae bacterium]
MGSPFTDDSTGLGFLARLRHLLPRQQAWLRAFAVLLGLSLLADVWATPARNLLPVYCEASLLRGPYFSSVIVSVRFVVAAVAAVIGGGLADAIGQRRVFLLGLSGVPVMGLLFLTGSPLALVALSVYIGFAGGAYYLGAEAYMLATVPAAFLGTSAALLLTGQTVGGALGGFVAAPLVDGSGFATYGVIVAVAALVVLAIGIVLLPSPSRSPVVYAGSDSPSRYGAILRRRPVLLLAALRFVPTCYYGTASLLMPLLIYRADGTASAAAIYGTVSLVFASLCQLLAGRIYDRVPRTGFAAVVAGLMTVAALGTAAATGSLAALYACGVLSIGLAWALAVATPGLVNDLAAPEEQGRILAVTHVAWYAGMVTGTQVAGLLVQVRSDLPFLVMGVFNLLAVAAAVMLGRALRKE